MTPHPEYVSGDDHARGARPRALPRRRAQPLPRALRGADRGLVSLPDAKSIARADWPYVQVIDVTDRDLSRLSVRCRNASPGGAVAARRRKETGALLVVADGRLAGIVTRADVMSLLQARQLRA